MKGLDDVLPKEWDRIAKEFPAIDPENSVTLEPYQKMADEESLQHDAVNNPKHYNTGSIECIEAIKESMSSEAFKGYLKGNCLKYLWRMDYKGKPLQDIEKSKWYLNKLLEEITTAQKKGR